MIREQAKLAKRQAILRAAGKLLARRRFAEITLDHIAAEADVAKGTLYLYFDSRESLYLSYVKARFAPLIARLKEQLPVAARSSTLAAVELLITEVIAFARQYPFIQDVMHATSRASQEAANLKTRSELHLLLSDVLRQGILSGEIANYSPELAAQMVLSLLQVVIHAPPAKPRSTGRSTNRLAASAASDAARDHCTASLIAFVTRGLSRGSMPCAAHAGMRGGTSGTTRSRARQSTKSKTHISRSLEIR